MKYYYLLFFIISLFSYKVLNQNYPSGKIKIISKINFYEYTFMNGTEKSIDTVIIYGDKKLIDIMNVKVGDNIMMSSLILKDTIPIILPQKNNKMSFGWGTPNANSNILILSNTGYKIYELKN